MFNHVNVGELPTVTTETIDRKRFYVTPEGSTSIHLSQQFWVFARTKNYLNGDRELVRKSLVTLPELPHRREQKFTICVKTISTMTLMKRNIRKTFFHIVSLHN